MKHLLVLLCAVVVLTSCSDEKTTAPTPETEFVAQDKDFANYRTWFQPKGAPLRGADPSGFLNGAHEENNDKITRRIFINSATATLSNGQYPKGTILVKEMKHDDTGVVGVMAMVKRGAGFNSANNGWDWYILGNDGKIQTDASTHGANLMNGMCNGCHAGAKANDYLFSQISDAKKEFIAQDKDFANYALWPQTTHAPLRGVDPSGILNGGAHESKNDKISRRVFINNPDVILTSGEYPTGTILVKEMAHDDTGIAAVMAMVKRGGEFNNNNNGWDWYILGNDGKIQADASTHGANLMNGMCNSCHVGAKAKDYLFTKG